MMAEDPFARLMALPPAKTARGQAAEAARRSSQLGLEPQSSFLADVLLRGAIGQGLLMGGGDEAEAYIRSALTGRPYEQSLEEIRQKLAVAGQERPGQMLAAEVAGGVLPAAGALVASGGMAAPAAAARVAPLAARVAQAAGQGVAVGAGQGAVEGFLKGEGGAAARLDRAAEEAMTGSMFGGAIGAAAPVVGGMVRKTFASPEERAARRMTGLLEESGVTPEQAAAAYAARQAPEMGGVRPEILADVMPGSAVARETQRIANLPGANRQEIAQQLTERSAQQGPRIQEAFQGALGTQRDFYSLMDDLERARSAAAAPLYQGLEQIPARSDKIDSIIMRMDDAAFDLAKKAARFDGLIFPNIVAVNKDGTRKVVGDYTVRDLDMLKRGLDRIIEDGRSDITGRLNTEARDAAKLKSELLSEIDPVAPQYAAARQAWAGRSAVMDAMGAGQRIFNERAEQTARDIARMSASEREGFVVGVLDAVNQRLGRGVQGRDITSVFRTGNVRAQIEAALGAAQSPERASRAADALLQGIEREAQMAATARTTRSVSATAPLLAQEADFAAATGAAGVLRDLAARGVGPAAGSLLERGLQRGALGLTQARMGATNEALRPYLFGTGSDLTRRLQAMQALMAPPPAYGAGLRQMAPGLLGDPIGEALGLQRR